MLATGLEGIEKDYEVPDPVEENVYEMTEEERREKSEVVRKALGDHVFDAFIQNKKIEWDQYRIQVTEYELQRYLPIL